MRRRTNVRAWIRVGAAAALSAALAWSPAAPAQAASAIRARLVVGSLNVPTAFTFGPGNRIWYVEKATGQIRIHDLGTGSDTLFATVPGVNAEGERGMLGIALDPGDPNDRLSTFTPPSRSPGPCATRSFGSPIPAGREPIRQ